MVTNTVQTIQQQLEALGLNTRGLGFVAWDANTLKVNRRMKGVLIAYNQGTDLYDVTPYNGCKMGEVIEGVYAESLLMVAAPVLGVRA